MANTNLLAPLMSTMHTRCVALVTKRLAPPAPSIVGLAPLAHHFTAIVCRFAATQRRNQHPRPYIPGAVL